MFPGCSTFWRQNACMRMLPILPRPRMATRCARAVSDMLSLPAWLDSGVPALYSIVNCATTALSVLTQAVGDPDFLLSQAEIPLHIGLAFGIYSLAPHAPKGQARPREPDGSRALRIRRRRRRAKVLVRRAPGG